MLLLATMIASSLLFVSFVALNPYIIQQDPDEPTHVHLTWQTNDTAHTMTITWQSSLDDSGDSVLYDTNQRNGNPLLYSYSAVGTNHTYTGSSGYIHDVELLDLVPNTAYYFICGGDKGGWSQERSFKTSPLIPSRTRLIVGGDSRTDIVARNKISQIMSTFDPDFVLFNGDMVADGNDQNQWDVFLDHMDTYWIGNNSLTIPIIPALGNHEKNSTNYYEQFALIGNEQWYSLNWGPEIHIIVLNSEANLEGIIAQANWLEEDLKRHESCLWKFVTFHRNVFRSNHESWTLVFDYWVPIFDKYHVDAVFNGHSHNYMRTKPINWTKSSTTPQSSYLNGTMYVVTGAWGAPLYDVTDGWWVAYNRSVHHFTLVDIFDNRTLHLQGKDDSGMTFDEIWIDKTAPPDDDNGSNGILPDSDILGIFVLCQGRANHICFFVNNIDFITTGKINNYLTGNIRAYFWHHV
ncbi:MAG: purple acid phosphatase family protein [Candidatus Hodarchaeota archaeon]